MPVFQLEDYEVFGAGAWSKKAYLSGKNLLRSGIRSVVSSILTMQKSLKAVTIP